MKLDRRTYIILGGGIALIGLFYILSVMFSGEKPIDWDENFEGDKKNPFGTYLLRQSLQDLFQTDTLYVQNKDLFNLLALQNDTNKSFILINSGLYPDELEVEELQAFVERGNHVFIAANSCSQILKLKLDVEQAPYENEGDSINISFTSHPEKAYKFSTYKMSYLVPGTNKEVDVLVEDEKDHSIMLRYKMGDGSLILCSTPRIFSNYYMVQEEKRKFIAQAFNYLPQGTDIWWDEYYKKQKLFYGNQGRGNGPSYSKMDYLLSQEGLKWAFWLSILALIVYAIFESKRKQRIIPVIEPLPNMTLDFTETVGRLYFRSDAHKEVAEKRIRAVLSHIRERYFLKTDKFDEKFMESLAAKSSISLSDIRLLFRSIERVRSSGKITESQLVEINHYIDAFYAQGAR